MERDGTPKFICAYVCKINELLVKFEYSVSILTFSLILFTTSKTGGYVALTLTIINCSDTACYC